jgi:hypothetical protein
MLYSKTSRNLNNIRLAVITRIACPLNAIGTRYRTATSLGVLHSNIMSVSPFAVGVMQRGGNLGTRTLSCQFHTARPRNNAGLSTA